MEAKSNPQSSQQQAEKKAAAPKPAPATSSEPEPASSKPQPEASSSEPEPVKAVAVSPSTDKGSYLSEVEQGVVALINSERESLGLNTLKLDTKLKSAARIRSSELLLSDTFAHARPDGRSWQTVLNSDVPVDYSAAGENLASYEDLSESKHSDEDWFNQWKNSPAHYENMIRENFTHVGVGIFEVNYPDGTTKTIATTIFCSY